MEFRSNTWGGTPLHIAVCGGHFEVVKVLCEYMRQDVFGMQDNDGSTPMHHAVNGGTVDMLEV